MDSADGTSVHITKYITFSIRQSNFYMEQTESDPLQDIENELLKEEPAFNDLINSGQWRIINDKAEITKILIPVFHSDGGIGWRLA